MMRSRKDQRGAVAVFAALVITAMLATAALAVDIGLQRVARADAQSIADVVALDLSHELNQGKTTSQLSDSDSAWVSQSIGRNKDVLGTGQGHAPRLVVTWGEMKDGSFVDYDPTDPAEDDLVPTAVRVVAHTETGFVFTANKTGAANRRAVASADYGACFYLGSFAATINSGNSSLLSALLNGPLGLPPSQVNAMALGYTGLAGANVSLLELVETGELGVGTVSELLAADDINVASLIRASAMVLQSRGGMSDLAIDALEILELGASNVALPPLDFGKLLQAGPSDPAALGASLNVLDLISNSLLIANGTNAVALPGTDIHVPGPVPVNTRTVAHVMQPPQPSCPNGMTGTEARTAQINVVTTISSPGGSLGLPATLGLVNASVAVAPFELKMTTALAAATGKLLTVEGCTDGTGPSPVVQVHTGLLEGPTITGGPITARINAGFNLNQVTGLLNAVTGLVNALLPGVLKIGTWDELASASVDASVSLAVNALWKNIGTVRPEDPKVTIPPSAWQASPPTPVQVPGNGGVPELDRITVSTVPPTEMKVTTRVQPVRGISVLGIPVVSNNGPPITSTTNLPLNSAGTLLDSVTGLLTPIINGLTSTLQSSLIDPLAKLLGLRVAGADVFGVPTPLCGAPRLVQ